MERARQQRGDRENGQAVCEVISSVTNIKSEDDAERILYERLLDIANQASAHRDERLSLSAKRMPRTLFLFVTLTASTILFLLFFYPFRNAPLGVVSVAITTHAAVLRPLRSDRPGQSIRGHVERRLRPVQRTNAPSVSPPARFEERASISGSARLHRLRKNPGFVSGYAFRHTASR